MFNYQKALDTIEELSEMACENECSIFIQIKKSQL